MTAIEWRQWGNDAFEESRQSGKPVLLSISAVWCHWCHVMDQTTYADSRVVELVNQKYIAVRVDNDREPDINDRYNMGGWPTTAFLTHAGDVITGGTYMPPAQMADLLERISSAYVHQHEEIISQASEARLHAVASAQRRAVGSVSPEHVERVLTAITSYHDKTHGGFGWSQKFPMIPVLEFLVVTYERTGCPEYLEIVNSTLDAMLAGEVFDGVEGGLFRYSTQRDWRMPHYEKMLSDNAGIAHILLDAYRLSDKQAYMDAATGVFSYLDNVLRDPETGVYRGSQDADEEYYTADADGRKQLTPPRVDTAAYTDTNAQTALALLRLWSIGKDGAVLEKALRVVDFFNSLERAADGTVAHYFEDDRPYRHGLLVDQVYLALANTVCFEATGRSQYIDAAIRLLEPLDREFRANNGAYHDISAARAGERGLTRLDTPIAVNSVLAVLLMNVAALSEDTAYRSRALEILSALAAKYEDYGIMAADYAIAVTVAHTQPVVVNVTGTPHENDAQELIRASIATCGLRCAIKPDSEQAREPAAALICVGTSCRARTSNPEELAENLREALAWI